MIHPSARALAGFVAAGILLAGCSSDPDPVATSSQSANPSASGSAEASETPSPSSTLTAEEQQAFEEATEVVLAYRQTITDLYSGARTNLNDLNRVATGDLVERDLTDVQRSLGEGWRYEPKGGQIELVSAEPVDVNLTEEPSNVVVRACVDTTDITDFNPAGKGTKGIREELDYTVIRAAYLPVPGWAVSRVSTESDDPLDRRC
jgi:hypothetical protein